MKYKNHVVDAANLPADLPTHLHSGDLWKAPEKVPSAQSRLPPGDQKAHV